MKNSATTSRKPRKSKSDTSPANSTRLMEPISPSDHRAKKEQETYADLEDLQPPPGEQLLE